jgi:hypothetical protein
VQRREFKDKVRAAIVHRAMNAAGRIVCEGCGLVLGKKVYHIDHTIPEAMVVDKSRPLTAKDGKLLGWDCCHKPKTAVDLGDVAKVKRVAGKHNGSARRSRRPMDGSKASGWRKPFNGPPERRY